jgi:hypothetical protein
MKIYRMHRTGKGVIAEVIEEILGGKDVQDITSLRVRLLPHIAKYVPLGTDYPFEFGYAGSGPSELARCILIDMKYPMHEVEYLYQDFKHLYLANAVGEELMISQDAIECWWDDKHTKG